MATITTEARDKLIALYVGMFKAAPGADNLSELVVSWESGMTLKEIAAGLTGADFESVYPALLTAQEFADRLVANMLGDEVGAQQTAWATNWIKTKLNAGVSATDVIVQAVNGLSASTNTNYDDAKAALNNKVAAARYYSVDSELSSATLATLQGVISDVTSDSDTLTTANAATDEASAFAKGQTYTLTTGVDEVVGTIYNDIFKANIGTGATLTVLDDLKGDAGNDALNINDLTGGKNLPAGIAISGIETINVQSVGAVGATGAGTFDTSTTTGVTALNILKSTGDAFLKAASTTAIKATGIVGAATVAGGATQTISVTGSAAVVSGVTSTTSTGAVTATVANANAAAANVAIDNGTDITVTASDTDTAGASGTINIGTTLGTAVDDPTGVITITQNTASPTGGAIATEGGTKVDVTVNATNAVNTTTTFGTIGITGSATATKEVNVTQTKAATAGAAVTAIAGVAESASVAFNTTALTVGQTMIIGGLTFTAGAAGATQAQVATAFANLADGDTHGSSTAGTYSGTFTGYSSGANNSGTVVFTSTAAVTSDEVDLTAGGTGAAATVTATDGSAAQAVKAGVAGVVNGAVTVTGAAIENADFNSYAGGSAITSNALTDLTLTSSKGGFTVNNTVATTLALTLTDITTAPTLALGGKYTTLNVTAATTKSAAAVTAAGVTALTVAGDTTLDFTGSTLAALKTVAVTGTAGITLDAKQATVTGVDTSATTGANTITIDGTKATYTGGAGKDTVTLSAATPTKAISLGAGDDSLTLATGTTSTTGTVTGGDGTDTLVMVSADAATAGGSAVFSSKVSGFETVSLTTVAGETVDIEVLGNNSFTGIISDGAAALTLNNVANNSTLTVTGQIVGNHTVNVKGAVLGTADVLSLVVSNAVTGTVTAANVETVNVSASATAALTLVALAATKAVFTGSKALTLDVTGNTLLTTIDGSAATGALTVTAAASTATTITGGSGADMLTASAKADILIGGAGNDTLNSGSGLGTLTGGAGNDTFVIAAPANVNSYSTVTDASVGDKIELGVAAATSFTASAVTLASTAVFQDYANAAVNSQTVSGGISWFQYGGDTYVVQQLGVTTPLNDFENGTDIIVKLTGLVDLSTATLNTDAAGSLELF